MTDDLKRLKNLRELARMKRTIFCDEFKSMKAFMADFGGWEMPIYITSIKDEHFAVRKDAGVFDVSHMSFFSIIGDGAIDFLNSLVVTELKNKKFGCATYTLVCNENGGIIDDVIVYKKNEREFFMMANAGNDEKIKNWFEKHNDSRLKIILLPTVSLALQGSKSVELVKNIFSFEECQKILALEYYSFCEIRDMVVARTGYTGEIGFEFMIPASSEAVLSLWNKLKELGVKVCGLGARDILRLEAGYPLYGHEMTDDINPLDAGLKWVIDFEKENFIGKKALVSLNESSLGRALVGIELNDRRAIPRHGNEIFHGDERIGYITSGSYSFFLDKTVAFALIDKKYADIGTDIQVLVRDKKIDTKVAKKRFYYNPDIKKAIIN